MKFKEKSIFIGNGFMNSQLLWIIPFVDGYAKEKKIKVLIFEKNLAEKVYFQKKIRGILKNYKIIYLEKEPKNLIFKIIKKLIFILKFFSTEALKLSFESKRNTLLEKIDWKRYQLRHAVWDQALNNSPDGLLNIPFKKRFISAVEVIDSMNKVNKILKNYALECAILGHTVYKGRGLLAELREKKVNILAHAFDVIHKVYPHKDTNWSLLSKDQWNFLVKQIKKNTIHNYWKKRVIGVSSYDDAKRAAIKNHEINSDTPKNVIFLHIFKDSPFNFIDKERIFSDYVDWIQETLKIISNSKEKWLIKAHPGALRWGENQKIWLDNIFKRVFKKEIPKNIEIDYNSFSNIDLFSHINRVVTFHGTVHLESACWGIKPIVISEVALGTYDKKLIYHPKTINNYKKLLLERSNSIKFKLNKNDVLRSRYLLYIVEEYLSLKKDIGSHLVYRNDSLLKFNQDFNSVLNKLPFYFDNMILMGSSVARGMSRTICFEIYKELNKRNKNFI